MKQRKKIYNDMMFEILINENKPIIKNKSFKLTKRHYLNCNTQMSDCIFYVKKGAEIIAPMNNSTLAPVTISNCIFVIDYFRKIV